MKPIEICNYEIVCPAPTGMRELERGVLNKRSFARRGLQVFLFAAIDEPGWRSIEQMIAGRTGFQGWEVSERSEAVCGGSRFVWRLQSMNAAVAGKSMQVLNGVIHCTKVPCVLQMNADGEAIQFSEFVEWIGSVHTIEC